MEFALFTVILREKGWVIGLHAKEFGPCPDRDLAVDVAIRVAWKAHDRGLKAQVMVHDGTRFQTIWFKGKHTERLAG